MVEVAKLKTGKKGAPPPPSDAPGNTHKAPRETEEPTRPLQFKVPTSVFEEFSIQAAKEGGGAKGAKVALFLKMWKLYSGNIS